MTKLNYKITELTDTYLLSLAVCLIFCSSGQDGNTRAKLAVIVHFAERHLWKTNTKLYVVCFVNSSLLESIVYHKKWRNEAELTSAKRWTSEWLDTFGIYSQVNLNQWWIQQFGIWGREREGGGD